MLLKITFGWGKMDVIVPMLLFLLVAGGYVKYGKNIFHTEEGGFSPVPWVAFAFLAGIDFANILLSNGVIWFEIFSGGIMFMGPCLLTTIIIFCTKRPVKQESFSQEYMMIYSGMLVLTSLVLVDYFSPWGNSYGVEVAIMLATILLDIVAAYALVSEIKESVQKFEKTSWILWLVAGVIAFAWNVLSSGANWYSIASLLILESAIVALIVVCFIYYYEKKI